MNVPQNQIVFKKKVGRSGSSDVTHIKTVGGLHLITKNGTVLGSGPHRAVARKIASQFEPDIEWTELSKSDYVDPSVYASMLPEYEALTVAFRKAQGIE